LSVTAEIEENDQGALITATITNNGYTAINASSVSFTKIAAEMDLLHTLSVGTLAPGQSTVVTYQVSSDKIAFLSEYTANSFVVKVETESDENEYANNAPRVMLAPVRVASVDLSENALVLALNETYALNATVAPGERAEQSSVFRQRFHGCSERGRARQSCGGRYRYSHYHRIDIGRRQSQQLHDYR
jgi:hypothetical protein